VNASAPPLPNDAAVWAEQLGPDTPWTDVAVVAQAASTNADLVAAAHAHPGQGRVLIAEEQTAGRGRLDRTWTSPPGTGLTFSVLAAPAAPPGALGWAPLLAGLAVAEGIEAATGLAPTVKWPNDVMVDDRKLAGLLAEVVPPDRLVIGVGLNTHLGAADRPTPQATSLLLEGVPLELADRSAVLAAVLQALGRRLADLADGPTSATMDAYRARCSSLGQHVRVERPGRPDLQGLAVDVADDASLIIDVLSGGAVHVAAGDVVHVR
jgi:BirA family transcriptional regulator, biotin operon repressor / biotin---[acetyl-CoA-carboxylase] ligase